MLNETIRIMNLLQYLAFSKLQRDVSYCFYYLFSLFNSLGHLVSSIANYPATWSFYANGIRGPVCSFPDIFKTVCKLDLNSQLELHMKKLLTQTYSVKITKQQSHDQISKCKKQFQSYNFEFLVKYILGLQNIQEKDTKPDKKVNILEKRE